MKATRAGQRRATAVSALDRAAYAVVRRIPRGRVLTYGQVAELAGHPGSARAVGRAMKLATPALGLPWHRVVGAGGRGLAKINILDPIGGAMQRAMLEAEGVELSATGRIALATFGHAPRRR